MTLHLTIITPDRTVFEGNVDSVVVPGATGSFGVLPHHAPMVSAVGRGILKAVVDGAPTYFVVNGGVADVGRDRAIVMADRVMAAVDDLDATEKLDELRLSLSATPMA